MQRTRRRRHPTCFCAFADRCSFLCSLQCRFRSRKALPSPLTFQSKLSLLCCVTMTGRGSDLIDKPLANETRGGAYRGWHVPATSIPTPNSRPTPRAQGRTEIQEAKSNIATLRIVSSGILSISKHNEAQQPPPQLRNALRNSPATLCHPPRGPTTSIKHNLQYVFNLYNQSKSSKSQHLSNLHLNFSLLPTIYSP